MVSVTQEHQFLDVIEGISEYSFVLYSLFIEISFFFQFFLAFKLELIYPLEQENKLKPKKQNKK